MSYLGMKVERLSQPSRRRELYRVPGTDLASLSGRPDEAKSPIDTAPHK